MLECQVHGAEDLRVVDVPTPQPAAGEVLLRLGAAGICGSDMHYYFHGRNGSFVIREPLVPGHEASAVVAAIGAGVTRVKAGDRVAVNPSRPCGRYISVKRRHTPLRYCTISLPPIFDSP